MDKFSIEKQHRLNEINAMLEIPAVLNGIHAGLVELARAKRIHPHWPGTVSGQIGIMMEEAGEVQRAANRFAFRNGPVEDVETELIQTLAMCLRCLENLERAV